MDSPVPIARSLQDIYTDDALAEQQKRWAHLLDSFRSLYGRDAEFVSRSPGRVNLIGEHIDYSMYSVLPMAITADVLLAVSTGVEPAADGTFKVCIANTDSAKFGSREFDIPYGEVEIDATIHEWSNYFKSGLRGALEQLRKKHGADFRPASMEVLMDGSVPAGAGLSSSAAFVTASALAVLVANGEREVNKTELTELAIVSERAVGVNSGGMDQSASVFSERGSALFVSFAPKLQARPVHFPKTNPELVFLIAQSFVTSDKVVSAPYQYNLRVVECTLAAAYLNAVLYQHTKPLPRDSSPLGSSLHGFHEVYFTHTAVDAADVPAAQQLEKLIDVVSATLTQERGYTAEEIADTLGITTDELNRQYISRFPIKADVFRLRQRALHVYREALRVLKFMELLENPAHAPATGGGDTTEYNKKLGALMDESQASCRDDFECSCEELDRIVAIARRSGSYGSRLTGAGWGGCTVHLVPADKVDAVRAGLLREYYAGMDPGKVEISTVVSRPGSGSALYLVDKGVPLV